MAGEAFYERYKDALRRGHVATLHGGLDEALDAYAEASSIAPERPTPHTSAGTALLRRGRPAEALRYYEAALSLAPRDEAALVGRAQALAALPRRGDAARAFDALADHRAASGRLSDAVDAARQALELAEGRERRRTLERLIERLQTSEPDEPERLALERALGVLEGLAIAAPTAPVTAPSDGSESALAVIDEPSAVDGAGQPGDEPISRPVLERGLPLDADVGELGRLADAALDDGDGVLAVERLLDLAAVNRMAGRMAAAMDACYLALAADPDHVGLHLALVQLYDDSGWSGLAVEKLDLLDRLVALDGDPAVVAQVAAARAARA